MSVVALAISPKLLCFGACMSSTLTNFIFDMNKTKSAYAHGVENKSIVLDFTMCVAPISTSELVPRIKIYVQPAHPVAIEIACMSDQTCIPHDR